jgi:polyvinyl alcohol dehydrogenase (cytochrome)
MIKGPSFFGLLGLALLVTGCQDSQDTERGDSTRMASTEELQARQGEGIDLKTHPGVALFNKNCLACHSGTVPKAPAVIWLEMMAPDAILAAMNDGLMKQQAAHLSEQERVHIAEYLARTKLADYKPPPPPKSCTGEAAQFAGAVPAKLGWGFDNGRFIPAAVGGITAADVPNLKLKWAFEYPDAVRARSQPAVGWNTIFVGSQNGTVYALDVDTGCAKWTFRGSAEIRTAIVADPDNKRLYFGDVIGRVYAIDAMTGEQIWRKKVDDHPNATITGTPSLHGGSLFVPVSSLEVTSAADPKYDCCTFRGSVAALDPATGAIKWQTYTVPSAPKEQGKTAGGAKVFGPSGAPVWNSPTYDAKRARLYFGSGENYSSPADANSDALFAIDAKSGKRLWQLQFTKNDAWNVGCMMGNENCPKENGPDLDLASSPLLVPLPNGKDIIVVGQKSGVTYGVDPEKGTIIWERRLGHGGTQGGIHFGMSSEGTTVYVPIVDMDDTYDGRKYDTARSGAGVHAIDAATGKLLWSNKTKDICNGEKYCDPGASSASTAIPGAVLAGHLDGWMRAYDKGTGKVIWKYNTRKQVTTISGTKASGGAMSGPGPAVYNGHVIFNSGYGLYYHMPGNVLLVFEKIS